MAKYVKFFNELSIKDVPTVGGKNASLGEMYQKLTKSGIRIPNGFATTAEAYRHFLKDTGTQKKLKNILNGLNTHNVVDLATRGKLARQAILDAELPHDFQKEIITAYHKLSNLYKTKNLAVAVRSSATAEDLPDASFAGQQETYLNVSGEADILEAVKKCLASLFTNRAISYRVDKKFDHFSIALSVGIQKMIRSDLAASGIMFTIDTETGFANAVVINSVYGLGENAVQGKVNPDEFYIFKPTMAIISQTIGSKELKLVYNTSKNAEEPVKNIPVALKDQQRFSITTEQVKTLAKWGIAIEKHYKRPMDIEWALDGQDRQLYIVQARPETVNSQRNYNILEEYIIKRRGTVLVEGRSVGNRIGAGVVNRILSVKDIGKFKPGQILVTAMTDPDWEPIMKIASAIVTDKGGRTCHAAIVSRELGIPCVVGTDNGSKKLISGQTVTVSCAEGDSGFIYDGKIPFTIKKTDIQKLPRPACKIMMNIGSPDIAFANSFLPNDGVGLAREEFIINNSIRIHPMALINYHQIKDAKLKKQIDELTIGYTDKKQFFIDKLAEGVGTIAAAFYPKDVIVRLSDFKTNEYANLIGGREYEPIESNPMIGWRGASRYYDPKFEPAFALECLALKKVREDFGLKNLKVMVPFCRTIEEGKLVIKTMAKYGLKQGHGGLEVYVMAEIPTNILLASDFAKVFDGFSIGSNDLTQLALGIDRDAGNLHVAGQSNEKNPSVKSLIQFLIEVGQKTHTKVGICGQAPSDFPDFAQFLLACGIDSISLNPDTVIKTTLALGKFKPLKNR
jgi:pyruvate,water dikinase